jgi:hypothetical protein
MADDWQFIVFMGRENWVAFAKRGAFQARTLQEAIAEPGDVWFAIAEDANAALAKVKAEVLH